MLLILPFTLFFTTFITDNTFFYSRCNCYGSYSILLNAFVSYPDVLEQNVFSGMFFKNNHKSVHSADVKQKEVKYFVSQRTLTSVQRQAIKMLVFRQTEVKMMLLREGVQQVNGKWTSL